MAWEYDPDNLTAGDVLKMVAPTIAAFVSIYFVNKYFPDFVDLAAFALIALVIFGILRMPKKDLEKIAEAEQRQSEKVKAVPVVGPALGVLKQAFDWIHTIFGIILFIWLIYWAVGKAL